MIVNRVCGLRKIKSRRHNNKSADRVWVTEMLEEDIRNKKVHLCGGRNLIQKSREKGKKKYGRIILIIEGSEREQYAELRDYLNQILLSNSGSTVHLDTTPMPNLLPLFKRVYISFEACKKGCRPFIGLDGTFLKGLYEGQLLTAIGQDANNQIFPIAYAVVDSKIRDN
ncbi:hypothetical protein Ahy_A09g045669 [Arachis hypogaea]|uniref:MULE transposase domain-containing protein n=1 Tax=Arachis hypogaea TaxID=3818 RepID=A0A445BMY3_ARAHY|nr:hypothetical protein Ahy_A09g045669 [Arachis hypogaea]